MSQSQQVKYFPPKIDRVFIFNPKFGPKEGEEHKKILFYWPPNTPLESQLADIGLSEALTNVTKTFTTLPVETLRTQRCRWSFLNPEGEFWMSLVVNNARIIRKDGSAPEYLEEDINDLALAQLLKKTYNYFKLLHGTFESIMADEKDPEPLKVALRTGLTRIIQQIAAEDLDIFSALDGIQFLPVHKNIYLKIQSLINSTENVFEQIAYSAFLYKDSLVWSGLEQEEMRFLYKFINDLRRQGKLAAKPVGFFYGPEDLSKKDTPINTLPVYIGPKVERYELVLFCALDMMYLLLIDKNSVKLNFFQQLYEFIWPQLQFLAPILYQHYNSRLDNEDIEYQYIYFNQMNLAIKTSVKNKPVELSRDILIILNQMHQDFERSSEVINEVSIRTSEDIWIVGKRSDQREFYVIFNQQGANLVDVSEEVKKWSAEQFNSIFID